MTHAIDPSFRLRKAALAASRRRGVRLRLAALFGVLLLAAGGAGFYVTADQWTFSDLDQDLVPIETGDDLPADAPVYVPAIVDLAGDPMWISSPEAGSASRIRSVERPAGLAGASPKVEILSDTMLSASERFMTTIPSTQEDFAFFQAQGGAPGGADAGDGDNEPPASDAVLPAPAGQSGEQASDAEAGWGETISAGEAALPGFKKTAVENNTTVAAVTPEDARFGASEDFFVRILTKRSLDGVILDNRFSPQDAKAAGEALKAVFARDGLDAGFVVALRGARGAPGEALSLMQVSVYAKDTFVGTLAKNGAGAFVLGADPWVSADLFHYSGSRGQGGPKRQYRLLDAIYSTAARNNVPTAVIGEAIMVLSRGEDLNAFATDADRLLLVYSDKGRGKDGVSGRVLYARVQGAEKTLECFVFAQNDGAYACVSGNDEVRSLATANGMVTPVKGGVMTSTFGPRMHPILHTVRVHKGVDWAAPVGTPVVAAFDGQVAFFGDGGSYGNLVRLGHGGGRETRYAHLQRFAPALALGAAVKAGDVIGFVGTTGRSTGPHLHFELIQGGEAVDPLAGAAVAVAAVAAPPSSGSSDDGAVEKLTDRIIHVESGGKAHAKNPLSSATGLGQFIESTWIRMMKTYRPDLAQTLSRADLLALRYDPTISREMVRNLAREGEAYLRVRGHSITAGRLYLCHFLGMEGAHVILSASSGSLIADVMGQGVIKANPFLAGRTAGYVVGWAEAKMNGRAPRVVTADAPPPVAAAREVKETSPEFEVFKAALTALVTAQQNVL